MPIRPAQRSDLHAAGKALAAAFRHEELFHGLMNPHAEEYPDDFARFFEHLFWLNWLDYRHVTLVSVDPVTGEVAGAAVWERQGKGGEKMDLWILDPRRLIRPLAALYSKAEFALWPNRAADPSKRNVLKEAFSLIAKYWDGERADNWFLDLLGVDPKYQGKSHGRELVQWGIDQAKKDGIRASVIAAWGKDRFYGRFGFIGIGMANVGPLNTLKGGLIMFTESGVEAK